MSWGWALAIGGAVAAWAVLRDDRRTTASKQSTTPLPPNVPPPPQMPPPVAPPIQTAEQPQSTFPATWFPITRRVSLVVQTTEEFFGWFRGTGDQARDLIAWLNAEDHRGFGGFLKSWSIGPVEIVEPRQFSTYFIVYRLSGVVTTVREERGAVLTDLAHAGTIQGVLGKDWQLRAWLGRLP